MKYYVMYLDSRGYTLVDEEEGIVIKDGTFYKINHKGQCYWLVMEEKAYSTFCKEEAKAGRL